MNIQSFESLNEQLEDNESCFLLLYKSGSEQSECAYNRLEALKHSGDSKVLFADVNTVRDIHNRYNISSAPTLLEFDKGKVKNVFKGCQTESFYKSAIERKGFASFSADENGEPPKRVTVYTTPSCTWCNTIKTYFKEKNVNFTEIDVASNPSRAEEMVKKSGQQGVPQTDINGQVVVGFDKNRINMLLDIK